MELFTPQVWDGHSFPLWAETGRILILGSRLGSFHLPVQGLQSMGSQIVRHNWVTEDTHTHRHTILQKSNKKKKRRMKMAVIYTALLDSSWMKRDHTFIAISKSQGLRNYFLPLILSGMEKWSLKVTFHEWWPKNFTFCHFRSLFCDHFLKPGVIK